jgi:hypothetical protein
MKLKDIISLILGGISLIVALVTGYYDAKTASTFALILMGVIWITWITLKLIHIENTVDKRGNNKKKLWIPYEPKIQFFQEKIHEFDTPLKRVLIKADFLEWDRFTILFWVNITEDFLKTDNNRYLFSYKSATKPIHKYENAFYLGIRKASAKEGEKDWRLLVGGEDSNKQENIEFSSNYALLGWKLFSITWRKSNSSISLKIDSGKTFSDSIEVKSDSFPSFINESMFTIGGWTDWVGGLSYSKFYNFRIYNNSFTDGELSDIYEYENELLKNTNAQQQL